MPLRLRPLRDEKIEPFLAETKAGYVRGMVEDGGFTEEEAVAKADRDFAGALPQGAGTPGHRVSAIEDVDSSERVGWLWFAERFQDRPAAFVYSLEIKEGMRGRGLGREAMLLLEDEARRLGLDLIALNVFAGNEPASSLYRSLGYENVSISMRKRLD